MTTFEEAFDRAEQIPGFVNIFFIRYAPPNRGWSVQITTSQEHNGGFRNRREGETRLAALTDAVSKTP